MLKNNIDHAILKSKDNTLKIQICIQSQILVFYFFYHIKVLQLLSLLHKSHLSIFVTYIKGHPTLTKLAKK